MASGAFERWGDPEYLAFGLALAAPLVIVPAVRAALDDDPRPWHRRYWFKFNLWIAIYVFAGSYVGSHYFFDVLGMRYAFPATWTLDAALVGHDQGEVPIFLYAVTQAYFATYHVAMIVLLRRVRTSALGRGPAGPWLSPLALLALAYAFAYGETYFMASDALSDYFWYLDRARMLQLGSLFYATYFVVSVPLLARVDEPREREEDCELGGQAERAGRRWPLRRVMLEALAASMLMFYVLDLWALIFGPLIES
jgi:cycloeucalenol cycloisomerase